jgi:transposase
LEKECRRNLELWWLLGRLAPDFKTIADFRRDNAPAIPASGRALVQFCREHRLLGTRVALDGSKLKSAGSKDKTYSRQQLRHEQRRLRAYLTELDRADSRDGATEVEAQRVRHALSQLEVVEQVLVDEGSNTACVTDPDARLMRSGRAGMVAGYNVQASVDEQSGVVVHHEVTQDSTDNRQLLPMVHATQAAMGGELEQVLADAGYSNGEHLQGCEDAGIRPIVPVNRAVNSHGDHYPAEAFEYDAERDIFRCPSGKELYYKTYSSKDKVRLYTRDSCVDCALKDRCTKSERRWVSRHFHESAFERSTQRLAKDPGAMKRRMAIVEPVFGTLKRRMGGGRFTCWGLSATRAEMGLHVLAHNLNRVMNLKGACWLTQALG